MFLNHCIKVFYNLNIFIFKLSIINLFLKSVFDLITIFYLNHPIMILIIDTHYTNEDNENDSKGTHLTHYDNETLAGKCV